VIIFKPTLQKATNQFGNMTIWQAYSSS